MAAKGITIYTPASAGPHVFAEDDAQIHRAILGVSGITLADNELALTVINNNTVRLSSGAYSMQGYLISVQGGTTADLTVESGSAGAYRHDLVVADFTRGGSDVADTFVFAVVKGTNAVSADAAADPTLTQNDLAAGGSRRQEAIYRLIINGTEIAAVERVAEYIGNYNAHMDLSPTQNSRNAVSSGGTYDALDSNKPNSIAVTLATSDWIGEGPYNALIAAAGSADETVVSASPADADSANAIVSGILFYYYDGNLYAQTKRVPLASITLIVTVQRAKGSAKRFFCKAGSEADGALRIADGYFSNLTVYVNNVYLVSDDYVVAAFYAEFTQRAVNIFAEMPESYLPASTVSFTGQTYAVAAWRDNTFSVTAAGSVSLHNISTSAIRFAALYPRA